MGDETSCLREWYLAYHSSVYPGKPCAVFPTIKEMKKAFEKWVKSKQEQLFNLICVKWNYPEKHKNTKFQDKVILASSLADFLNSCTLEIPSPITTAVLLVRMGLEKLCKV
jgi:hypothetical protein